MKLVLFPPCAHVLLRYGGAKDSQVDNEVLDYELFHYDGDE